MQGVMAKHETPLVALKRLVRECGTQAAAADKLEITQQYLCDLLRGRRGFSDAVANKLGYERVWVKLA
jgi:hypothetical protein